MSPVGDSIRRWLPFPSNVYVVMPEASSLRLRRLPTSYA